MTTVTFLPGLRWAAVPALLLSLTATAPPAWAQEGTFDRTLKVTGAVGLSVRSGSGSIRVTQGPADTVRIVGRIRAHDTWFTGGDAGQRIRQIEQRPPVEQAGNTIRIGSFDDERALRGISISYDITVPAATALDARTGSGSIEVGAIAGAVTATSGSGSLDIGRVSGAVVVSTGSGSIAVAGAARLDARTGSGSIRADAIGGPVTAKAGSGQIRVAVIGKGDVEVSAASGGVTVTGVDGGARVSSSSGSVHVSGRPSGRWSIHASSGSVRLDLPADASFDLDAVSSSGSVETTHPVTVTGAIERRRLRGQVRSGGPLIEVRASSGSIRIR